MKDIAVEEVHKMDYLDYKAKLLHQIGLTDLDKVKKHLVEKCANSTSELNKRIKIDNAARQIMMDYYDGDRTYVVKGHTGMSMRQRNVKA